MKAKNLKVNGLTEPIGYSFDHLTFSWETSGEDLDDQSKMTVTVALDPAFKQVVAQADCASGNLLTLAPDFLKNKTRYFWRVQGLTFQASSFFETGLMDDAWQAKWISYQDAPQDAVCFSKKFMANKAVKTARLYLMALGLYEASLNGQAVSLEYLTPGYHSYDLYQQYQTFDVTHLINSENELTVMVGNGWYKGRFLFDGGFENIYGDKQKLIAQLEITYEDGSREVVLSDESWNCQTSFIKENSIYDGERQDLSTRPEPLQTIALTDDRATLTERLDLPVKPVRVYNPRAFIDKNGDLILDFEQEITGWIAGRVETPKKQVKFTFGELLQDGRFYRDNLRTAKQEFIVDNIEQASFIRPHFTYFGFRYVKVEGLSEAEALRFKGYSLQSEMEETFSFASSSAKLNQLLSNVKWSQRDNFLSIPTDCPQRDERLGWTGDIGVFANTASYNMETRAFFANYLRAMRAEQLAQKGAVPVFVPYPKIKPFEGINPFLLGGAVSVWGDAATILPITSYRHCHDQGQLKADYPLMKGWVDYILKKDQAHQNRHLFDFDMQLGDWLALDTGIKGSVMGATDSSLVATVYYWISAQNTADAAAILDYQTDNAFYQKLADEIKAAILTTYFKGDDLNLTPATLNSPTEQIRQQMAQGFAGQKIDTKVDTQTGLALLLHYRLYPSEAAREKLADRLQARLEEAGNSLTTGFAGTPALLHALSENGLDQAAFDLLFKEDAPSWLFEVSQGATTTWERWDSLLSDGRISGTDMNSMNHYAYGSVEDFIVEKLLGINLPELTGDTWKIAPHFTSHLTWAQGKLMTANGPLEVKWVKTGSLVETTVILPPRTKAVFIKQDGSLCQLKSGSNQFSEIFPDNSANAIQDYKETVNE
ncbi:family 78 glycoside hydrolase catalytic domain [Lactobacillus equicursoris]|uniref:family 78 glycoside hydrolase catalytic domain n=1 Tax=Lactobacillus equicursoris TaxID=420645 RepID=UPI0039910978